MGLAEQRREYSSYSDNRENSWEQSSYMDRPGYGVDCDFDNAHMILMTPKMFEDAQLVLDHLKNNQAIVVNLESVPHELARRLVDFLAGGAYGRDGQIQKIAVNTYLILPRDVTYTDEQGDEWDSRSYF